MIRPRRANEQTYGRRCGVFAYPVGAGRARDFTRPASRCRTREPGGWSGTTGGATRRVIDTDYGSGVASPAGKRSADTGTVRRDDAGKTSKTSGTDTVPARDSERENRYPGTGDSPRPNGSFSGSRCPRGTSSRKTAFSERPAEPSRLIRSFRPHAFFKVRTSATEIS